MNDYLGRGSRAVLKRFKFSEPQINLTGKVLSLIEEKDIFRSIWVNEDINTHCKDYGRVHVLSKSYEVSLKADFNVKLRDKSHKYIEERVREALKFRGIDPTTEQFGSYVEKSFYLKKDRVDVHFGFQLAKNRCNTCR